MCWRPASGATAAGKRLRDVQGIVLITGASRGIGAATALRCGSRGDGEGRRCRGYRFVPSSVKTSDCWKRMAPDDASAKPGSALPSIK